MTVDEDKAMAAHAAALVKEQSFEAARLAGISVEEAERILRTGRGTGEQSYVPNSHAATVAKRADERQTQR